MRIWPGYEGIGTSVSNLAFTAGSQQWMGGLPGGRAGSRRLGPSRQAVVQKVVDALAATMHWISIRTAAQIADAMPPLFASNGLTTKADFIAELAEDEGQFLPDGRMPAGGP